MPRRQKSKKRSHNNHADFEVSKIKNHMILKDNLILYNVEWKPTIYNSTDQFIHWIDTVQNITEIPLNSSNSNNSNNSKSKHKKCKYKVQWKDSWLPPERLTGCDEILPAYILLNMKQKSNIIIQENSYLYSSISASFDLWDDKHMYIIFRFQTIL